MQKAERDQLMTRLSQTERNQFRRLIQDMRAHANPATSHGMTARQVLESRGDALSLPLRMALEAVVARDEMGPQVGEYPPDFTLKRRGVCMHRTGLALKVVMPDPITNKRPHPRIGAASPPMHPW